MTPKRCQSCGAYSVLTPVDLDLQASVTCTRCGESYGTWRAVESNGLNTEQGSRPASDLRKSARSRAVIGGKVVFNDRHCVVDCTLRNLSESGAKLVFSAHVPVPDEFDLELPQKGRTHRARVMWWAGESCGVMFLPNS